MHMKLCAQMKLWLWRWHFFFIVVVFFLDSSSAQAQLNPEGQSLLQFKASIELDPQALLRNWNSSDPTPCLWTGVSCSPRSAQVTGLSLPHAQLLGSLSPRLGSLPHLRHLNLHHNHLHGSIPPALFNASRLQSFFLFSNNLSGSLPPALGGLTQLQSLDVSSNSLAGFIPDTLANCNRLRSLVLSRNSFSGPIPASIGSSLRALKELDLSSNLLTDSIPAALSHLQSLQGVLNLSHNQLSGSIPASLGGLPVNLTLDLSNNNLSGPVPRNGSLATQGRAAFLGNPGLCGFPLQNLCSESPPSSPLSAGAAPSTQRRKGLSRAAIIAISIGDAAGIAIVGFVFLYYYWRRSTTDTRKPSSSSSPGGGSNGGGWLCNKDTSGIPENVDQGELVALDDQVTFNLDDLLKASAYVLGKSGVGIVYKVIVSDGLTVAVRRLGEGGSHKFKEFQTEVQTIGRIRHPNLVTLRAYYWASEEKLLVYDFIPNGSMVSALHGQSSASSEPLLWSSRLKIARGTARGLAYLHENGFRKCVHGDIKPSNILLGLDMEPYVADFGLNRLLHIVGSGEPTNAAGTGASSQSSTSTLSGLAVNPDSYYQVPEAAKSTKPTQKWDVYSLGLVLLELLTGKSHVQFASLDIDLAQWIQAALQDRKPLLQIIDPMLVDQFHKADEMLVLLKIALACVALVPDERPSMRQVADSLEKISAAF